MVNILRTDPFEDVRALMDWPRRSLFDMPMTRRGFADETISPIAVDVFDQEGDLVVRANVPGVRKQDIKVDATEGILNISAERHEEKTVNERDYYLREYREGRANRALRLPVDVDASRARASYENGVLEVRMPKRKEASPHSVGIAIR